jgi:subtilisin family serine protease
VSFLVVCLLSLPAAAAPGKGKASDTSDSTVSTVGVIIHTPKPYKSVIAAIERLGGTVTYRYKYVDAFAAELSQESLRALRGMLAPNAITKDLLVRAPTSVDTVRGKESRLGLIRTGDEERLAYTSVKGIGAADLATFAAENPNAYLINNSIMNIDALHTSGVLGQGMIVGVIDSGIRPGFPHIDLDGSVIGCEDFVGDALGCSHVDNSGHGTFVAGMISANVVFTLSAGFTAAVQAYCPSCFLDPPTNSLVPMLGSAPLSSIYAFRVFGPTGI